MSSLMKESPIPSSQRWTRLLIISGIITTLGFSLPVGYNISVINSPSDIIKAFCNSSIHTRFGIVLNVDQLDNFWAFIVSIFLIGGTIGSLFGSIFADKVGRKGALITSSILAIGAGACFLSAKTINSVEFLILGRFLVGLFAGLVTTVMPMYLTELAPKILRGSAGVLCPLGVTCGVLLGQIMSLHQILGNEMYWPSVLGFYLIPLIICTGMLHFLPESPKYLFVIKKTPQLALKYLAKIREIKEENLYDEMEELYREARDAKEAQSWNIIKVLKNKKLLLPICLVCSLQAGQQFSGINAVFYYSVSIFQKAGLSLINSQLATIGAGCCNLLMAIISIPVMARFSRRSTLKLSLLTSIFFLIILGIALLLISSITWMPYISIIGVLGFVLCYGIALGPVPYFIGSELFEVAPRPSAMALGSMANWGGNFFIGLCFPSLQNHIGANSFFIFASITLLLYFFIRKYLPETFGKNPTDISVICSKGFQSNINESFQSISVNTI